MSRVTLYTRRDCHLCQAAAQVIAEVRQRRPFDLEVRNVDADPADRLRYDHHVPVICVNGVEIARHRLEAQTLSQALDAAG